jgi:hypothetical protein
MAIFLKLGGFVNKQFSDIAEKLISQLEGLNREAMKSVLTYGEMSMSESQFKAFRKVVLDLYGGNGLHRKVRDVVTRSLGIRTETAGAPQEKGQHESKGVVTMR